MVENTAKITVTLLRKKQNEILNPSEDYSIILKQYFSTYTIDDYYLSVGVPTQKSGWILHVTVIPDQLVEMLKSILPVFQKFNIIFKLAKSKNVHIDINAGNLGKYKIGKIVTAYLEDTNNVKYLIPELIESTKAYIGPRVFTDFQISNVLYTRFGSYVTMIRTDPFGNCYRILEGVTDSLVLDRYYSPPIMPSGIPNPFIEFFEKLPKTPKIYLALGKYLPLKLLKSDAKGDVWKGLYLNNLFCPKQCVIKQGRRGMFSDSFGRDTINRLAWQNEVNKILLSKIPIPRIIEYQETKEQSILVMDFIAKSRSLGGYVSLRSEGKPWCLLSVKLKEEFFSLITQIISIINRLHTENFIHRDITATNFLIDKKKRIVVIDPELMYDLQKKRPDPPFGVGTFGYMSPEQAMKLEPTKKDDIYSLGALFITIFLGGLEPIYVIEDDYQHLESKLQFFLGENKLVSLIIKCISKNPLERPNIEEIQSIIEKHEIKETKDIDSIVEENTPLLKDVIRKAINTFSNDAMTINDVWFSQIENEYGRDVYPFGNKHLFISLYRGVAGVIWLLSNLKINGFDISRTEKQIDASLNFLNKYLSESWNNITSSYYFGKAGLGVMFSQAIRSGILPDTKEQKTLIQACFQESCQQIDLLYGISGQIIAILNSIDYLSKDFYEKVLPNYTQIILEQQNVNGSWSILNSTTQKIETNYSLGYGMSGIIFSLLEYSRAFHDKDSLAAAENGLAYLVKKKIPYKNGYTWVFEKSRKKLNLWWCSGLSGIALTFLKAHEVTNNVEYLNIATKVLEIIPEKPMYYKASQCHGLSGLGEVFLEAFRATKNERWLKQANWISQVLLNLRIQPTPEDVYWLVERTEFPTADFMIGNGGIIHFLLRCFKYEKIGYPLLS